MLKLADGTLFPKTTYSLSEPQERYWCEAEQKTVEIPQGCGPRFQDSPRGNACSVPTNVCFYLSVDRESVSETGHRFPEQERWHEEEGHASP